MESQEQIEKFKEFIEKNYLAELADNLRKDKKFLIIDFNELSKFNPELADLLLEQPEDTIKAAELAIEQLDLENSENTKARFSNLPKSQHIFIRNIRSKHLNKLFQMEGIVRQKSDVRPQVTAAKFECPSCGNIINILQLDTSFKEPSRCGCGRKGKFHLISKELVDAQGLVLEEDPESLEGGEQPKRVNIFLKDDLVSPLSERKTSPGSKIRIVGLIKDVPIILRTGTKSTRFDLLIEANYVEAVEETFYEVEISEEEERQIKELAEDPKVYQKLINSVAQSIYGYNRVKEAILLQMVGGVHKTRKDGVVSRGDMHVLLVGDPGSGKSALLKRANIIAPKSRYVSGKGVSAAGLCVAPDSLLLKNPGSISKIQDVVEERLENNSFKFMEGIWQAKNPKNNDKVFTVGNNLKVKAQKVEQFWKLKAPEEMVSIELQSGRIITITKNTQLLTIKNGRLLWKKPEEFKQNGFLATIRNLDIKRQKTIPILSLISQNPIVYGVKDFLNRKLKNVNKRELAKKIKVDENCLYYNWVNKKARGNIHLDDLRKILNKLNIKEEVIPQDIELSLYRGYKIKIPKYLNEDLMYFSGLIAGDGDLSKGKNSVSIRFSNNSDVIMHRFKTLVKKLFNVNCNISSKRSKKRSCSLRFSSLIVTEILNKLGIPISPKSHKIDMSNLLLKLPNDFIAPFIRGIFDCDGSVIDRKNKGSSYIVLSSTSKQLIQKTQLVLLRWGINSKIRNRGHKKGKINSRYDKFVLEIKGKENLIKFRRNIGFSHSVKKEKLNLIINRIKKFDTNVDVIPETKELIKNTKEKLKINSRQILGYKSSALTREVHSRNQLKKIVKKIGKISKKECEDLNTLKILSNSDIFWDKIKSIKIIKPKYDYVYDLTVHNSHNFLVDGVVVHNTASVVRDEFLRGWSLEAGAMVLTSDGLCCTTEDSQFILENGKKMSFRELFNNTDKSIIVPRFKVLALNTNTLKIEPFAIKKAFRIKNDKKIFRIKTRTGRELNLTEDNEILICENSKIVWKPVELLNKNDFISVPKKIRIDGKDSYSESFAYVAGLIASDGHIKIDSRHATTSFYNTDKLLIDIFKEKMNKLGYNYSIYVQKKGRRQIIRNRETISKKDLYNVYNSTKEFAKKLISFGVKKGNKSIKFAINDRILTYRDRTIASFLKGIFDGDGSIRLDPIEVTLTSGIKENAILFQEALLRLGISSSIKKSTNSWHCDVRGAVNCTKFFDTIGTSHIEKYKKFEKINPKEVKDRIDVLPNHQDFFKGILKRYRWKLGKHKFKYFWNYARKGVAPPKHKLALLNRLLEDPHITMHTQSDVLWDKVVSIKERKTEFVYDFTMKDTDNFIANNIIMHNCIDEMDKISSEDRGAMHEAMENQSYHPDTEILFSDGSSKKIGLFVDALLKKNKDNIINGKDCEILNVGNIELLTTDFNKIFPIKATMVSRHKAPNYFIKITYSNGRSITVTPEHPIFIFKNGKINEMPAEDIKVSILAPTPRRYPTRSKKAKLSPVELTHPNNKKMFFPTYIDKQLSKLLGYIVSEGHSYYNPHTRYAEVGVSNTDNKISLDVKCLFTNIFKTTVNVNTRKVGTNRRATISNKIKLADIDLQKEFLRTVFKGDGFIDSGRFGFSTASYGLAGDYQDILLQHGVETKIDKEIRGDNDYYKVVVCGTNSMQYFYDNIVEKKDKRILRIKNFCEKSKNKLNQRDPVPNEIIIEINRLLKNFRLSDGYFYSIIKRNQNSQRNVVLKYLRILKERIDICKKIINSNSSRDIRRKANIPVKYIAEKLGVSSSTIYNIEKKEDKVEYKKLLYLIKTLAKKKLSDSNKKFQSIWKFVNSNIKLIKVKRVEKIKNKDVKWVYDITVEPTKTFISEGLVLHNTVSISKANIQATLIAKTTVLAAANPKFGRFDPYGMIAEQIDLPPTLINRFDLIFTIKDLPDEKKDSQLATHILSLHQTPDVKEPEVDTRLLKKYIGYAKRKIYPRLTDGAIEEIKKYYLKMRASGGAEEGIKTIPISPRQLEALIRLSEANAKIRLSDEVTRKDAKRAIALLEYSLMDVGFDRETGKIDIDRIATGVSASARSHILTVKEIINELEAKIGKTIPIDDIVSGAKAKGIEEDKVEEIIEKLKRIGDVFEPRPGWISKLG